MTFTDTEYEYLRTRSLGRLATIGPGGEPHSQPVAYWLDATAGTIDIGGPNLRASRKYRNVLADPRVSFVVDDEATEPVGPGGQRGRGVEIRGVAEPVRLAEPLLDGFTDEALRIHARRIVAWNVDGPGRNSRDIRFEVGSPG